jgi:hypothetical protein
MIEFSYVNATTEIGETYMYYVTTLDERAVESTRSRIVKVTMESVISPSPPLRVNWKQNSSYVVLSMLAVPTEDIEKFEIYRTDLTTRRPAVAVPIVVVSGKSGFTVDTETRDPIANGFSQIGEALNSRTGGASFIDRTTVMGRKYVYRVYAVDVHGNKSQDPKVVVVFVNERGTRTRDLRRPTVLAEVDETTKQIKLTIGSDDKRLISYFIARRNLTLHERAFVVPTGPSRVKLGVGRPYSNKKFEDTVLRSLDNSWTGYFSNTPSLVFADKTSRVDNIYQYAVFGIDEFGEKTSYEISPPIFVSSRPLVSRPLNVTPRTVSGTLVVSWDDGNLDIDPLDRIGDRDVLAATAFRTLFQVERKKLGEEKWFQFPLVETRFIEDKIGGTGEMAPAFRPPFLEVDAEYLYRVAAFQTGGFISNFSDPIAVNTFVPVTIPANFRVKTSDYKVEPFVVALNWDTLTGSGIVDHWTIERAEVNNYAAARLNVTNESDISKLSFTKLTDVLRESSRSRGRADDDWDKETSGSADIRQLGVLSGQHHYLDSDVRFGNTYFYRIVAFGLNRGNQSRPLIRGVRVSDVSFDRKLNLLTTQSERDLLARSTEPLVIRTTALRAYGL